MPKLPPLTAVRAFEAASRHLNFTKAAEELGMTQAAVSYQIKVLEDRVGTALFVRLPRQVALTPAGARLAPQVTEAFEMLQTAFAHTSKAVDNVLSLSVSPTVASNWLVPRLGRFQMAHPQYAVQLSASATLPDFTREAFDLAVWHGDGSWPGLETHLLFPLNFTPMCGPGLLRGAAVSTPKDILKLPIIGPQDPGWIQWFEEAQAGTVDLSDRPENHLSTQQIEGTAVMAGQGVALLNPLFFAADLAAGRIVQLFDLVVKAERSYWVVYPKARRRSPKIRAFCEWILDEASRDTAQAALNEEGRHAYRPFSFIQGGT